MNVFRIFQFIVLVMFALSSRASFEPLGNNELDKNLAIVKSYLNHPEWKPTDSLAYKRVEALISYLEHPSLDSLIINLAIDLARNESFLIRDAEAIKGKEELKGYISDELMKKNIENIKSDVRKHIPSESILVPETEFVGMYGKLPIIPRSELNRMIDESLVEIPANLAELFSDTRPNRNREIREHNDSVRIHFLDSARIAYNQKIIGHYRDSLAQAYRERYYQHHSDSLVQIYRSAVNRSNHRFLLSYNEAKTREVNSLFLEALQIVAEYANSLPNDLTIINSKNEAKKLSMKNNESWDTWLWLKNLQNDSIGIRVEGLNRNSLKMMVDESVNLSRLTHKKTADVSRLIPQTQIKHNLSRVKLPKPIILPWSYGGKIYTGFSETFINDYWARGGSTSASILSTFNYYAHYMKEKLKWENSLDAKLGMIFYLPDPNSTNPNERISHKNSDNLDLSSKLGVSAFKKWYYSTEMVFKTQFFNGYKNRTDVNPASAFLSPAYLNFSIGLDYKPNTNFSLFLSPVSLKTIIVTNPMVNKSTYGLTDNQSIKSQMGAYGKLDHSRKFSNDISMITKNTVFINFSQDENGEPLWYKVPDLDSETTLNFKVNQFVTTTVNAHFIYDKNVKSEWTDRQGVKQKGTRLQIKQYLTLGFTYRL